MCSTSCLFVILALLPVQAEQQDPGGPQRAKLVTGELRRLATGMGFTEGPVWLPAEQKLVFSDIPNAKLMEWSEVQGLAVFRESPNPNGNLLDLDGRLLTCQHGARNLVRTEEDGSITVLAERFEGKRFNSPNDVAVRSDGSLWFTDPPWGLKDRTEGKELPGHWVFRLDPDGGTVTAVVKDLAMPNGIAFSLDEQRLYVADTGGHPSHPDQSVRDRPATITAYDVSEQGGLLPEPAWRIEARCDGMCIDEQGNLYATAGEGVKVWSPDGSFRELIETPEQPANVCFGGADYRTLFITARTSLYAIEMEVKGNKPRKASW